MISEKAKEKQRGGQGGILLSQKSAEAKIDTRSELASLAGVSHDTIAKVKVIEQSATPEAKEKQLRTSGIGIRGGLPLQNSEKAKLNQGSRTDLTSVRCLTNVDTKKELASLAGVSHDRLFLFRLNFL